MRVVMVGHGSREDVEPMAALARRLQYGGVEVRMCAPPEFAELLTGAGVPLTPIAPEAVTGDAPATRPEIAAELTAMTYEAVVAVAEDCAAVVTAGSLPAVAGARAAAEKLGVRHVTTVAAPAAEAGARAATVAETVRTDGAERAAKLLLDMIDGAGSAVSAKRLTAEDRLAIQEVISLHGHLCDCGAYRRFDLVFTPDLELDTSDLGLAPLRTDDPSARLDTYIAAAYRRGPGDALALHVTNVVVGEDGDGARAWSKGLAVMKNGSAAGFTYEDRLVRTDQGWRIRHRKVSPRREPGRGIEPLVVPAQGGG